LTEPQDPVVLLNISGEDRVGLMSEVTAELARVDAQVLDIGQAIVHSQLVLGLLVRFPGGVVSEQSALNGIAELASSRDVGFEYRHIPGADYDAWVGRQGQPRYILTLLSPGLTAGQIAAISAITSRHGLNILSVERLSNRVPLADARNADASRVSGRARASVAMTLRGALADEQALKIELLAAGGSLDFDCSIQLDSVYRRNRRLVAFDMDSPLIPVEVIDELARLHGVYEEVAAITERAMAGELDFQQSFRARVALLEGMSEEALHEVANNVPLSDGAERLIRALKHFGYKTAVLSGGFQFVGDRLGERLGIDHVYANELVFADGRATGEVAGPIVDAAAKARILGELCVAEGISPEQAIALGDGANDLPMLAAAGLGIAFHAKPVVRSSAGHAISRFGLDGVLYLLGFSDSEIERVGSSHPY
jgi:phosphoserine phosphatase